MKLGVKVPYGAPASAQGLKEFIRAVDAKGFSSMWMGDHYVIPERITRENYKYLWRFDAKQEDLFPSKYFLEAMTTCAFIAGVSDNLAVGVGVIVVPMRNPVELAAQLATLDVLSDGKVIAGVGAGWMREEFEALNRPYDDRGKRLDESIAAMRALWDTQPASYEGELITVPSVYCEPVPLQAGGPPIWVGGDSDIALRRTVRVGNGWQPVELPPDQFAQRSARLDDMLRAAGRDPSEVQRSVSTRLRLSAGSDTKETAQRIEQYYLAGCDHLILYATPTRSVAENMERAMRFHDIASEVLRGVESDPARPTADVSTGGAR